MFPAILHKQRWGCQESGGMYGRSCRDGKPPCCRMLIPRKNSREKSGGGRLGRVLLDFTAAAIHTHGRAFLLSAEGVLGRTILGLPQIRTPNQFFNASTEDIMRRSLCLLSLAICGLCLSIARAADQADDYLKDGKLKERLEIRVMQGGFAGVHRQVRCD